MAAAVHNMLNLIVPHLAFTGRAYDLAVSATAGTTITLSFGTVPGARSYQYSISSTSAIAGFGAWTALAADKIITGLASSTQYWVKVRLVNGIGRGPESPVVTGTTASAETTVASWTLSGDDASWGTWSARVTFPVTGMTEPYLVGVIDFGAASDVRQITGLGTIPTAGATAVMVQNATNSYNSAAELTGTQFNGRVFGLNRVQIRGSGAGREIRGRFEAPSTGTFAADNVSIGVWSGTTDHVTPFRGSTVATPVELKFSTASGLSISNGATLESDWMPFPV